MANIQFDINSFNNYLSANNIKVSNSELSQLNSVFSQCDTLSENGEQKPDGKLTGDEVPTFQRLVAENLSKIIYRSAGILGVGIEEEGALEIAGRCRGTPRIANNLLRRARDYAQVKAENVINQEVATKALSMLNIDIDGLDEMDIRILEAIIVNFHGGPVGVKNIAVSVGEDEDSLADVYEPFLIQKGYIVRTPKGRVATPKAWAKVGLNSKGKEEELF